MRKEQYEADRDFRDDIKKTLWQQEEKSIKQVRILVENLIAEYDKVTRPRVDEIKKGLGFLLDDFKIIWCCALGMSKNPKDHG